MQLLESHPFMRTHKAHRLLKKWRPGGEQLQDSRLLALLPGLEHAIIHHTSVHAHCDSAGPQKGLLQHFYARPADRGWRDIRWWVPEHVSRQDVHFGTVVLLLPGAQNFIKACAHVAIFRGVPNLSQTRLPNLPDSPMGIEATYVMNKATASAMNKATSCANKRYMLF